VWSIFFLLVVYLMMVFNEHGDVSSGSYNQNLENCFFFVCDVTCFGR
jgi:hypothetical protein